MLGLIGLTAAKYAAMVSILLMSIISTSAAYAPTQSTIASPRYETKHAISTSNGYISYDMPSSTPTGYEVEKLSSKAPGYKKMLNGQLSKYSPDFYENIKLRNIHVVESIYNGETKILGYAEVSSGRLVLSAEEDRISDPLVISTIHHELAHLMVESLESSGSAIEAQWPYANVDRTYNRALFPADGFVSRYAMTSWREDLADTFGFYNTPYYKKQINQRIKNDSVLAEKINLVENLYDQYK